MSISLSKPPSRHHVGVALSSGVALGAAHIGVLQAFVENGIPIDCIAGTSAGAIIAACYAFGVPMDKVVERTRSLSWYSMSKFSFSGLGLFSHAALKKFLDDFLSGAKIEEAPVPLAVVATDLETGQHEIFTKGPLVAALTASASVPGLFVPMEHEGRMLVDGALVDSLPFDALAELGATVKIGVDVNRWVSPHRRPKNVLDVVTRSMEIATAYRKPLEENELLIEPHLEAFTASDFNKADKIVREGYRAALLNMDAVRTLLKQKVQRPARVRFRGGSWWERFKAWIRA